MIEPESLGFESFAFELFGPSGPDSGKLPGRSPQVSEPVLPRPLSSARVGYEFMEVEARLRIVTRGWIDPEVSIGKVGRTL